MNKKRGVAAQISLIFAALAVLLSIQVSCSAESIETPWLNEANSDYELAYDGNEFVVSNTGTLKLHVTAAADGEELTKPVIWLSSAPNIASVDNTGLVSGKKIGTATISCLSLDGKTTYAAATIEVVTGVKKLSVSDSKLVLLIGAGDEKAQAVLQSAVIPEDAHFKNVIWFSSDETVASVDNNGIINAKGVGTCIISAVSDDNGYDTPAKCEVTVLQGISQIDITPPEIIWTGESYQLTPVILPENASLQDVMWESSDSSIAAIDANGNVKGKSVGTVTIRCMSTDGSEVIGECTTQIAAKTQKISFPQKSVNLLIGAGENHSDTTLELITTPVDAYYQTAVWTSSDENVVTVDNSGNLHAVGFGDAEVTAISTDPDNKAKATCKVTVTKAVGSIKISETEQTVYTGTTLKLDALVEPADAANRKVVWTSSNPAIATVDASGNVRCISVGTCDISCTAADGSEVAASCKLNTIAKVTGITLSDKNIALLIGAGDEKLCSQLSFETKPIDAFYQTVAWVSSDENIVTVDTDGTIHANGIGEAIISAVSDDPDYNTPATCKVSVGQAVMVVVLSEHDSIIYTGESVKLDASISPDVASNKKLVWASSDPDVATVDSNGNVKGISVGTAVITCSAADGSEVMDNCEITVRAKVKGIKLDQSKLQLAVGNGSKAATGHLDFSVQPENAFVQTVTWTSSDENVITVDSYGILRAIGPGKATVSAISDDPDFNTPATCQVSVGQAVTSIQFVNVQSSMRINSAQTLKAEVLPADAANKKLLWESSDPDVLSVDANGNVRAIGIGSADIICKSSDGTEVEQRTSISVIIPLTQIIPTQHSGYILVGQTTKLSAKVSPSNATNKDIEWQSNSSCVAVSANGSITGIKKGTATITGTAKDGSGVKCSINVTVEPDVPVELSKLQYGTGLLNYGTLNFTFKNQCSSVGIKKIIYTVRLSGTLTLFTKSENTFTLSDLSVRPGGTISDSNYFPKYSDAKHVTVTIDSVVLSDGTKVNCNSSSTYDIS